MATAKYVRRRDFSSSGAKEGKLNDDILLLNREIYKELSNLTKNKTIALPTEARTKYDRWLIAMNNLSLGLSTDTDIIAVDEYLGELGLTREYPFSNDVFDSEPWIKYNDAPLTRNIVYNEDNVVYASDNIVLMRGDI